MNRDGLCIKEVELFKAAVRWVSVESERQGFHLNFGGIVKLISFPLMSMKDFMSHIPDSNILTSDEIIVVTKQFNGVPLQNPLPFLQTPRKRTIRDSQKNGGDLELTRIPPAVNWFSHTRGKPPESTRY